MLNKGQNPKISVILTTFNRVNLLEKVLDSFIKQTIPSCDYELIVLDDGSTDQTSEKVSEYVGHIPLKYVYQWNAGLAAAKNHGLALAASELVLFLDDDDSIESNFLEEHINAHIAFPSREVAILGFTHLDRSIDIDPLMRFVTEDGGYLFNYKHAKEGVDLGFDWFWGGRTSVKKSFLLESGGFNPVFQFGCEDIELGYRLQKRGLKVRYWPKATNIMLRKIGYEAFCERLRRQGRSQFVFSRLHRDRAIQDWCEMPRYYAEWGDIEPQLPALVESASKLNEWASIVSDVGAKLDPEAKELLFNAYHRSFAGCKLQGISQMESSWID